MKLYRFINEHVEEILVEWESFARTLTPAADGMSVLTLRDHAKEILHAIAVDIETHQDPKQQQQKSQGRAEDKQNEQNGDSVQSAASIHGSLRQASDFSLLQLNAEYRALRATVLRLWLPHVTQMSEAAAYEMLRFNEAIDQALAESTATFSANAGHTDNLFRAILGIADYAIYTLSPAGEVTNWNPGAERTEGYARNEVIGTHFERFFTQEARSIGLPMHALETAAKVGRFESEGWRVRKDGSKFWAHVMIDPIRSKSRDLVGYATVTRDMTEPREAAAALERAKEALFQSQKLQAIGRLTGGVAHDFNNLLAIIVSGTELLSREVKSSSGLNLLASMQRAASRGATLTQQLLSFARQQPMRQDKFNLSQLIGAFEAVLRRAGDESISFNLKLDPLLSPVRVDAAQFEAGLLNLVTNARDAMPRGGMIFVTSENVQLTQHQVGILSAGHFVKVTVTDTGTGMPSDVAAKATEPFFTTKELGQGTGMGLSQVYGLMQQSGGDMLLETEVGKGTSVSLYLPALDAADHEEMASPETNAGNDKALIVDDQPDVLHVAVELFKTMGYDVLSATSGLDAIEILKRTTDINVLFSDVRMPVMDGLTLGREARKVVPGIKVILVSGFAPPALTQENHGLRDFHFLRKPFRMSEVVKMLRMAV